MFQQQIREMEETYDASQPGAEAAAEAAEPAEGLPSSDEILRGIESLLREQRDEPGEDAR